MTPEEIEKELESRRAVVDCNSGNIVSQQGKRLRGECSKCGECCRMPGVPYPDYEKKCCRYLSRKHSGDGMIFICNIYPVRPIGCALWPEVIDKLPEECTLYFE